MQTHSCQVDTGIYASTECTHFFFFFPDLTPDKQMNPSLKALFTTHMQFLRESIPYFLQATLTISFPKHPHGFYCFFAFFSTCFSKMFSQCIKRAKVVFNGFVKCSTLIAPSFSKCFPSDTCFASLLKFVVVALHKSRFFSFSFCQRVYVCETLQVYLIVLW